MFIYVFSRPDNLEIAPGGSTVHSGFTDVETFENYVIKSLNQLAIQMSHKAGAGVTLTQDASTKALQIEVKKYDDIAFKTDLADRGLGSNCKLLKNVSLNTQGVTTGRYFADKCTESPDKEKVYILDTLSYEGYIWQNAYSFEGDRFYRFKSASVIAWSGWKYWNGDIPTKDVGGNIWFG